MPLAMATARDAAPPDKARRTIAMLSVAGAAGAAAGYPISGLLATAWGLPGAYWFGTAVSLAALLAVVAVVPSSASLARPSRLDWRGAGVLSVGLAALLLGTAEGSRWGWTSSSTWVTLGAGIVVLGVWARQQLRTESPLVELRFLRHPAVLAGNICGAAVGVAMYMHVSGVSEFAQSPTSGGFGFAASTARAGLILLPFAIFMMGGSRALPMLLRLAGMSAVLAGGCITSALASAFFALFHGAIWTALVSMSLLGLGLGTTFAAIPGLIIDSIPARETGSAMGFYTVVRYVSFSVGSAMTSGIVIARESPARTPTEGGYVTVFWTATAVCLVGAILSYVSTRVSHPPAMGASSPPDEVELLEMTEGDGYLGTPAN
jgi:predicted MFS family arabinose efflux permease